ncbi:hypothetical protein STAS_19298 [Striga asiatica]|uniref:DUF868 family protein n=1 Tax=Striga asiatica TaxID=4170 RepID=A0A5A7QBS1_STRAF|nr:hypothetical protein STAS_19298 [Striga asiatica]
MFAPPPADQKPALDDPAANKPTHNFVTCVYTTKLGEAFCNVTATWAKTLISHTLYITVECPDENTHYTCKIDLKTWQFWGKKGLKTFSVSDKRVDVFWDLRSAKFTSSPQPNSDFYVAMVSKEEVVLLLGDQKNEALRRTRRSSKEHSIVIESSLNGPYDPEMWISVDGTKSIRVPNLHWRFRGNETIVVDDVRVQILWDVHDWLYSGSHSGVGIFVFRRDGGGAGRVVVEGEDLGDGFWDEVAEGSFSVGFCHFLYAWRIE